MGKHHSNGEQTIFATAQSLHRRLDKFNPNEFDLVVADECFTGDVEILTEKGFVRFDELADEKVAQVHDDRTINFVSPKRKIKKEYSGKGYEFVFRTDKNGHETTAKLTAGHSQPLIRKSSGLFENFTAESVPIHQPHKYSLAVSGYGLGRKNELSPIDRLAIAMQADGTIQYLNKEDVQGFTIQVTKKRKQERLEWILKQTELDWKEIKDSKRDGKTKRYSIKIPAYENVTKLLSDRFDLTSMSETYAVEFLKEIVEWDGHIPPNKRSLYYSSVVKENVDFVSAVATLGGYECYQSLQSDLRKETYKDVHRLFFKKKLDSNLGKMKKREIVIDETVYCVTVPTGKIIARAMGKFTFISGNCHEAQGKQYKDIINYFTPTYTVGLTGTPFRLDGKKLTDNLFDKIVFQRNIKWGIEQDFLCDVEAVRVQIGYDLSGVRTSGGDYNIQDLEQAMVGTEHAVAEAYYKYGVNKPTLIFATGVAHAYAIASLIEGSEVIVGSTKQEERDRIFNSFQNGNCSCIVSVQVMTQGVDLPISTVGIFAKPTKSVGRYQQQVGRILRNHPDKEKALIVDCVGSSSLGLCTAPSLIGINVDKVPENKQKDIEGDLMDMIDLVEQLSDTPTSWIKNTKHVELWAKENKYNTKNVNYFQMPDGRMVVSLPERAKIVLPAPDMLGKVNATEIKGLAHDFHQWGINEYGETWDYQRALNAVRAMLERAYGESSMIWDLKKTKRWGNKPATPAQMKVINRKVKEELPELNRFEASQIINRVRTK